MREKMINIFNEMWSKDHQTKPPQLEDDTVLLETGFDSMAFAVFIARLDEELGFDPFTISDTAFYPTTFGEFVRFYQENAGF